MSLGGRKMQSLIKYVKERKVLKEKMKRLNIDFTKSGENILPGIIRRFRAKRFCFLTKREMKHLILLADNQEKLERLSNKYISILKEASKPNSQCNSEELVLRLETVYMEFNEIYEKSLKEIKEFENRKKRLPL